MSWQVQGLNTEYERLRKESEGKGAAKGPSSAMSEGPSSVQGLRKEVQSLQVPCTMHTLWLHALRIAPAALVPLLRSTEDGSWLQGTSCKTETPLSPSSDM